MAIVATILANFVNLWLVQALESKIDTLEINKRPGGGGSQKRSHPLGVSIQILNYEKASLWAESERGCIAKQRNGC